MIELDDYRKASTFEENAGCDHVLQKVMVRDFAVSVLEDPESYRVVIGIYLQQKMSVLKN